MSASDGRLEVGLSLPDQEAVDIVPSVKLLEGQAVEYLGNLVNNIKMMLVYCNSKGIALPDDLREKVGTLLTSPEVGIHAESLHSGKKGSAS